MNPDTAAGQFRAIADKVVGLGPDPINKDLLSNCDTLVLSEASSFHLIVQRGTWGGSGAIFEYGSYDNSELTAAECSAITEFVDNGGTLLWISESGIDRAYATASSSTGLASIIRANFKTISKASQFSS